MVQIALATDDTTFQPTLVAMLSAIENARAPVRVHFIGFGLSDLSRRIVERAVGLHHHAELAYHEGNDDMLMGFGICASYISAVCMSRLHLPRLAQGKVLWLDSDVLVHGNVAELFDIDIGDALIGAVRDMGRLHEIYTGSKKGEQKTKVGSMIMAPQPYQDFINSGVVLFNLDAMKSDPGVVEALASQVWLGNDQDTINYHCKGRVAFLNSSWNVMAGFQHKYAVLEEAYLPEQERSATEPANIIHFVGGLKPWHQFEIDDIAQMQIGCHFVPADDLDKSRAEYAKQVIAYRKAQDRMLPIMLQGTSKASHRHNDDPKKEAPMQPAMHEGGYPLPFSGVETLPLGRSASPRVVYATDQNYVKPTLISMMSLLENASTDVDVLVIGHNLSSAAVAALKRVEEIYHNATVNHLSILDKALPVKGKVASLHPPVLLSRFYIPVIFGCSRVLYLDSDTFVCGDVSPLFDMNMDDMLIAAVKDGHAFEASRGTTRDKRARDVAEVMGGG